MSCKDVYYILLSENKMIILILISDLIELLYFLQNDFFRKIHGTSFYLRSFFSISLIIHFILVTF